MEKATFSKKKVAGLVIAVLLIAASFLMPESEQLTRAGITALAVLLGAVVLWITETFPAGVTGFLAITVMVLFGVAPVSAAFSGMGSSSVAFTIAVFSLTIILMNSNLGLLLTGLLLKWAKSDSKRLVLAFMMASAILSSIMSNLAVSATFMGIAYTILNALGAKPGKSNFGKCLMLGIPIAAINGGMGTPAGGSLNIVALGLMEQMTGKTISFLDWTLIGFPLMLVMTPICWFFIVKLLKPEQINPDGLHDINRRISEIRTLSAADKKVIFFIVAMPVLWILGNWIPVLNVTVVSILGMALMFLPGIELLHWDDFQRHVPWNIVLMMGSVISLGSIVGSTGGTAFLANFFLESGVVNLNSYVVLFLMGAFAYYLHTILPVGPAILTLFYIPMLGICEGAGISAAIPTLMLSFILSGNYLLPVNPNLMVTYSTGYYSSKDVLLSGAIPSVIFLLLFTFWAPFMAGVIGI